MNELITALTQFGAAGLIGFLWIVERRHGAMRAQQLTEAHQMIADKQRELEALMTVVKENTRALHRLEKSQEQLVNLLELLRRNGSVPPASRG